MTFCASFSIHLRVIISLTCYCTFQHCSRASFTFNFISVGVVSVYNPPSLFFEKIYHSIIVYIQRVTSSEDWHSQSMLFLLACKVQWNLFQGCREWEHIVLKEWSPIGHGGHHRRARVPIEITVVGQINSESQEPLKNIDQGQCT